jgi:hypothetical protein
MDRAVKGKILAAAKAELLKHSLGNFVDDPPSVAQGGQGVVVSGRPACRRSFGAVNQLMHHLADDVLPVILRTVFKIAGESSDANSHTLFSGRGRPEVGAPLTSPRWASAAFDAREDGFSVMRVAALIIFCFVLTMIPAGAQTTSFSEPQASQLVASPLRFQDHMLLPLAMELTHSSLALPCIPSLW